VKFSIEYVCIMPLSSCKFCDGAVKGIHLLRDVNFNLPVFSIHFEIWYRGCPQKFMECYDFVSVGAVKVVLRHKR